MSVAARFAPSSGSWLTKVLPCRNAVLIVTEHQIAAYTENALPYRVQTYNISIEVTEQASE